MKIHPKGLNSSTTRRVNSDSGLPLEAINADKVDK